MKPNMLPEAENLLQALRRSELILQAVARAAQQFLKTAAWEQNVPHVLKQLGEAAGASRAYVFERFFSAQGTSLVSQRHEWVAQGISPQMDNPDLQDLDWRAFGYARWENIFESHALVAGLVREFPEAERDLLSAQGILALVVVPIFGDGKLWGFIGFDQCDQERVWSQAELDALQSAADMFGAALTRRTTENRLLERQRTLELMHEIIGAALAKEDIYEMSQFLVDHLGILIGADRCFLNLWDEHAQRTVPVAAYGESSTSYRQLIFRPGETTLTAQVLKTGQSIAIENVKESALVIPRVVDEFKVVSILALPMISGQNKLGAVLLGFHQPHVFSTDEMLVCQRAADLVALAIAKFQAIEQAQRRADESETLRESAASVAARLMLIHEIIHATITSPNFESMMQNVVDRMAALIGADQCFITQWDEARRRTLPAAASEFGRGTYQNTEILPGEKTFTQSALDAGHTLVVEDVLNSPYMSQRLNNDLIHSALVLPLIADGRGLGAIILAYRHSHIFKPEEIEVSEQAAGMVALAVAKFQAVDLAQRRVQESETLRRAGMAISETLNMQEATTRLLEQLAFVIPHDSASVQLLRDGELEIIDSEGWDDKTSVVGVRFPVPSDNPNTVVIQTRKPYLVEDTYTNFPIFRTTGHAVHIRSWLGVPLIVHNQVIGLLAIDSREINHFTPEQADLAMAFAAQVAVAIENARLFNEVQKLAITDGLTGLHNRRHFMELAETEFDRARRYKRHLSLVVFDIDHFKSINDTYGHPAGDEVLRQLAALCRTKLREVDPAGRYGGEEFIALIIEASPSEAHIVAERLRTEVEKMVVQAPPAIIKITVSVGIASQDENTPNLETLIARADQALYIAKHKGRNQVTISK